MPPRGPSSNAGTLDELKHQETLIRGLRRPAAFPHEAESVRMLETHISYVFLTGRYAYKIKKAVDLGFVDYRALDDRRRYCDEEVRLNRRLAPDIYLEVAPISGPAAAPVVGGSGPAIEYAVKMREFSQHALLSHMLDRGELTTAHIDALADRVAAFHGAIEVAGADGPFGRPDEVHRFALDNFGQLHDGVDNESDRAALDALRQWTDREYHARRHQFQARRRQGFVRECHGDLHLNNIALVDDHIAIFDCIEFNDHMRWGDVMGEVAFVVMDLEDRKRPDLAFRFLNGYLERTGDYSGLAVLQFFLVYRAMVRAKVTWFRAAQLPSGPQKTEAIAEYRGYVKLAERFAQTPKPAIVQMHGLAGSGKTTYSQTLLEAINGVRIRSDVERKRLHGLLARTHSRSAIDSGLYTSADTRRTYEHMYELARQIAAAGYVAIVDAASLKRWQRDMFRDLASELGVPFAIVVVTANDVTLRQRVAARAAAGHDASDADADVLDHQQRTQDPLAVDEQLSIVTIKSDAPAGDSQNAFAWQTLLGRLHVSADDAPPLVTP
jgi:aminoglycoside phosphotransferase family enzyme/predicted kinase